MRKLTESYVFELFTFYLHQQPGDEDKPSPSRAPPSTDRSMSAVKFAEGYIKPK